MKRIGRYLLHAPRTVRDFPLQDEESIVTIDGFTDADFAGGSLRTGRHVGRVVVDDAEGGGAAQAKRRGQHDP